MREIVRRMGSNRTHLADVESTSAAVQFGATYRKPPEDTKSFCGVAITNGVVMQAGTVVTCRSCRFADMKEAVTEEFCAEYKGDHRFEDGANRCRCGRAYLRAPR